MSKAKRFRDDERKKEPRVDGRIRVPEVLVIDSNGEKLGVMATYEALRRAKDQGLNLVEVAPTTRPPVCRILDYGKFKYDQKRAQKVKRKNQVVVEIKEVKFRPKIERHDYEFKLRHVVRFLAEGDKVKATIMFRGRELAHTELGEVILRRVLAELEGKVVVEQQPKLEGRNMTMLIAPKPGAWPKPPPKAVTDGSGEIEEPSLEDLGEDDDHDDEAMEDVEEQEPAMESDQRGADA